MASNAQSTYVVNGETITTTQLRQKIIDVLGYNNRMTVSEIEQSLGLLPKKLQNVMSGMAGNYLVLIDNTRNSKRYVKYYNHPKSALQDIYHPLPKGYAEMKGTVYKEKHAKHNIAARTPYETFNFSSIYNYAE